MAAISSEVATGRWMKGRDGFIDGGARGDLCAYDARSSADPAERRGITAPATTAATAVVTLGAASGAGRARQGDGGAVAQAVAAVSDYCLANAQAGSDRGGFASPRAGLH